jgi:hypothetical protein
VPAKVLHQIPLDGSPLIICGDFNATHSAPSQEYIRARSELETTQAQNQLQPGNTIETLLNELNALDRRSQDDSYMAWKAELSSLPVPQRLKIMNRCLRAGTCLSSTSVALDSYREHFSGQFTNSFGAEQFQETTVGLDQATTEIGLAAQTFSPELVAQMILRSPAGKAPGISGISAELLHPVASEWPRFSQDSSVFICHCPWSHLHGSGLLCVLFPKKGILAESLITGR